MSSTSEHEHARQLLGKAREDLDALKGMLAANGAYSEAFSEASLVSTLSRRQKRRLRLGWLTKASHTSTPMT
jgi:hypothetical protein